MQRQYIEQYHKKYPVQHSGGEPPRDIEAFTAPADYSDSYDHLRNFFESVRSRKPVVEDPIFTIPRNSRWLIMSGHNEEAQRVLELMGLPNSAEELAIIQQPIREESTNLHEPLFQRKLRLPIVLAVSIVYSINCPILTPYCTTRIFSSRKLAIARFRATARLRWWRRSTLPNCAWYVFNRQGWA